MKYLFIFLFGVIFLTCQTNTSSFQKNEIFGQFPMAVGYTWEYSVQDTTFYFRFSDSMQVKNGIMQVKIIGKIEQENREVEYLWQYRFNGEVVDTLYVVPSGDSLFFYYDEGRVVKWMLVFPLQVGKSWEYNECDKYRVIRKEMFPLPIRSMEEVFVAQRQFMCEAEASLIEQFFIHPRIGLIRYESEYFNIFYGISRVQHWKLKSYRVNS